MATQLEKDLLDNAFLLSAKNGKLEDVKKYLAEGASINAEDKDGKNALFFTVLNRDQEMAAFLVASGINKNHQNHDGNTPLIYAVACHRQGVAVPMVQALLSWHVNADIQNEKGDAAIHFAIDDLPSMKSLLQAAADLNVQNQSGLTPLMRTAGGSLLQDTLPAFRALLAAGADLNLQDKNGFTALMWAVVHQHWLPERDQILRGLVDAGADIFAEDNKGLTAIDHAANHDLTDAVKYLKQCALEKELSGFKKGLSRPIKATRPIGFKP